MGRRISKEFLHPSILEGVNDKIGNLDSLETDAKDNMVQAINELADKIDTEIAEGKELIANAVGEPLTAEDTFSAMGEKINELSILFKEKLTGTGLKDPLDGLTFKQMIVLLDKIKLNNPCLSVSLNSNSYIFNGVDETYQLLATLTPEDTTDELTWLSTDDNIAIVDDGLVTSKSFGKCEIKAICGEFEDVCEIDVKGYCTNITMNETSHTINAPVGTTYQLTAITVPSNTIEEITWTSSEPNVVSVSDTGLLTSLTSGSSVITATCGGYSTTCDVTVTITKPCTKLTLYTYDYDVVGEVGSTVYVFNAYATPSDTTDTITWTSSNTGVATIASNGYITIKGSGSTTITAKCGDKTASSTITVTVGKPATGITTDPETMLAMAYNSVETATVKLKPSDTVETLNPNYISYEVSQELIDANVSVSLSGDTFTVRSAGISVSAPIEITYNGIYTCTLNVVITTWD